jgi:hypothetical protein
MGDKVQDITGKWRELQDRNPVHRPDGAGPDCKYCTGKRICAANREFYTDEAYKPCRDYREVNEADKEHERLKELKKITVPAPRPEGAAKDCLHCARLRESALRCYRGPWQGAGRICDEYHEVDARSEGEARHCLFCLENYKCERGRVVRDGKPCGRYVEYAPANPGQTAG